MCITCKSILYKTSLAHECFVLSSLFSVSLVWYIVTLLKILKVYSITHLLFTGSIKYNYTKPQSETFSLDCNTYSLKFSTAPAFTSKVLQRKERLEMGCCLFTCKANVGCCVGISTTLASNYVERLTTHVVVDHKA